MHLQKLEQVPKTEIPDKWCLVLFEAAWQEWVPPAASEESETCFVIPLQNKAIAQHRWNALSAIVSLSFSRSLWQAHSSAFSSLSQLIVTTIVRAVRASLEK